MLMTIVLEGISKSFGAKRVFENVNLEFKEGRAYALMGPSGYGKTTLIRIIMGLLEADEGKMQGVSGLKFAPVFQEDRLCENLSAGANIRMASRRKLAQADILETLAGLELRDCLHQPVKELSGGMKRRVAMARSLLSGGDTYIFDEPFRALDSDTKNQVMDYVSRQLKGKTLIWVTHDLKEAEALESQIIRFPLSQV